MRYSILIELESGIFGKVPEDMGRGACFGQVTQVDSVDRIHEVSLGAARSAGIRDRETGPSLIPPGRMKDDRCQVDNPMSLDGSIRLDEIRQRHQHDYGKGCL